MKGSEPLIYIKVHRCCIGFTLHACKGIHYISSQEEQLKIHQSFLEKNGFPLVLGSGKISSVFWLSKSRRRAIDKTGGTLCYTAERVCKLVV